MKQLSLLGMYEVITGINHINLSVSDIDRSFHFYRELVGLKPICKWPKGAYFLAGNDWFCLNVSSAVVTTSKQDYTHYAFSVSEDKFDEAVVRLSKAGLAPFKNNMSEGESFYFLDPDGHLLEIHVGDWRSRLVEKKLKPWPHTEFFI